MSSGNDDLDDPRTVLRTIPTTETQTFLNTVPSSVVPPTPTAVVSSPHDEVIYAASSPRSPALRRQSLIRPSIVGNEGVDLVEDGDHLDRYDTPKGRNFLLDSENPVITNDGRGGLRRRVPHSNQNELEDIVIRLEAPVEGHRHHTHVDGAAAKSLSKQEYNILRQRKEAALDYHESCNNIYGLKHIGSKPSDQRGEQIFAWIITICIGIIVGAVGIGLRLINTHVSKEKWKVVYDYLADGDHWAAWGSFIGLSLCFAIPSAFIVIFVSPLVGSSGIPDVKTYLNGSNIPNAFASDTLVLKLFSMTLTVLGPIPSGLQGPMIHVGATFGGWVGMHFRRVVKRVCCCARQDQEIRDEEDLPYYPHPVPAVTFAPGYRAVVQAVLAGVRVERSAPEQPHYEQLPVTGAESPPVSSPDTAAAAADTAACASPGSRGDLFSLPPVSAEEAAALANNSNAYTHADAEAHMPAGSPMVAEAPFSLLRASTREYLPFSALDAADARAASPRGASSPSHASRFPRSPADTNNSNVASSNSNSNSADATLPVAGSTAGALEDYNARMRAELASYSNAMHAVDGTHVSLPARARTLPPVHECVESHPDQPLPHTPRDIDKDASAGVGDGAGAGDSGCLRAEEVGAQSSYMCGCASTSQDATVDGDIVPVSSTGRSALFQHTGVMLPDSTRDVTADQHEFRKRVSSRAGGKRSVSDRALGVVAARELEMVPMGPARSASVTSMPASGGDAAAMVTSSGTGAPAPLPIYVDSYSHTLLCPRWLRNISIPAFSTDAHRRDFISIGCAAGMSASMGAPIGGVLYVLEEMGSYWSHSLALRILAGSVLASVTAAFIGTAVNMTDRTGEFLPEYYATFFVGRRPAAYRVEELPAFIVVGIFGGLLGAAFTVVGERIAKFRAAVYGKTKLRYALFTLMVLVVWSSILFALPFAFSCVETGPEYALAREESVGAPADVYSVVRGNCAAGWHNPMSMLSFTRFDVTVKRLLARGIPKSFSADVLVVWLVFIFFGSSLTSNVACTPGIILPFLMIGTVSGRLIGALLYSWFGHADVTTVYFDPGVYATVGAAAFFAGATRTTLSMSILVLEITSDLNLLLPILIGAFTAHLTSSMLSETYYEVLIRLRKLPFLRSEPAFELAQMTAAQLMIRDPVRLGSVETVAHILDVLESCTHNGFPVILQPCAAAHVRHGHAGVPPTRSHTYVADNATGAIISDGSHSLLDGREMPFGASAHVGAGCDNTCVGMILRVHLLAIINRRVWRPESRPFTPEDYDRVLARASPKISELRLRLTPQDLQASVDLVPWVNSSAYVVPESMIGSRVFMLFRQLNLRHLPVVDINRGVVGMITRLELLEPVVKHRYGLLMQRQEHTVQRGGPDWREDWCQRRCALEQVRVAKDREREMLQRQTDAMYDVMRGR